MSNASDEATLWLIWSNEHGAWWKPDWRGYTRHVADAGRYPLREAVRICRGAAHPDACWIDNASHGPPNEVMVPSPRMVVTRLAEELS